MWDDFNFDYIVSAEFCVSTLADGQEEHYQVPADVSVQDALRQMARETRYHFEREGVEVEQFELSEKYAATETLVADLASEVMALPRQLYAEEGFESSSDALGDPVIVTYYFGVFRDNAGRKLVGVRRANRFKGVLKNQLISLFDDTLRVIEDRVFRLDHDFDFLITSAHVYILRPEGFNSVALIEQMASQAAHEKALELGEQIAFAHFERIAAFARDKKRAARIVAALHARDDLGTIRRAKFISAAQEAGIILVKIGQKVAPQDGHELAFLELLDRRRYTTDIAIGAKEKFVASSRKRIE